MVPVNNAVVFPMPYQCVKGHGQANDGWQTSGLCQFEICSFGEWARFCLAKPPHEYIVYQPGRSSFTVSGLKPGGLYNCEWYDPGRHEVKEGQSIASSSAKTFAPANRNMVLYLKYLGHNN
jgi:hypothetical protein